MSSSMQQPPLACCAVGSSAGPPKCAWVVPLAAVGCLSAVAAASEVAQQLPVLSKQPTANLVDM
jgi:hypothetical protein